MDDISCLTRVARDGSFGTATLQFARLRVIDCSQFPVPPCSGHPRLHPVPIVTRPAALRTFTVRSFANFIRTFLQCDSSPCARSPKKNEGCDYENKDPFSGLLSANALDAAPCTETPRCVCQDHRPEPRAGNTAYPQARGS